MRIGLALSLLALALALAGCGSPACTVDADCASTPDTPSCAPATSTCAPRITLIGMQGALAAPVLTQVYAEATPRMPTGFDFNPRVAGEVWMTNYADASVTVLNGVGSEAVTAVHLRDPARDHFMYRPTGIAFTEAGHWGTCGDHDQGGTLFAGPALFDSDRSIFGKQNPEAGQGLGSHLDMLHASPLCMGIVHVSENQFWVFDGHNSAIVLYDFKQDHGPGFDDHSDGEIFVHATGSVLRQEGVPSHLAYDPAARQLYVADTGHQQVLRVDTTTGVMGEPLPSLEPSIPIRMDGTVTSPLVPAGLLDLPSGMAYADGVVYVGDAGTGTVYAFDAAGRQWASLATGLPRMALGALQVGPDGKLYLLDRTAAVLYRVDVATP